MKCGFLSDAVIVDASDTAMTGSGSKYDAPCRFVYQFTGKERDTETGLDYFGARYYGSNMGRWMSPDYSTIPVPVPFAVFSDPQTLNLYSYVRNNPMALPDPNGHAAVDGDCDNTPCIGGANPYGINPDPENDRLWPSASGQLEAEQNPLTLKATDSQKDGSGGEINYQVVGDTKGTKYGVVQHETDYTRLGNSAPSQFGPGTSLQPAATTNPNAQGAFSNAPNQFNDKIMPGIDSKPQGTNSIQTFFIVPLGANGAPVPGARPQPILVQDRNGNKFYALGAFVSTSGARINGNAIRDTRSVNLKP